MIPGLGHRKRNRILEKILSVTEGKEEGFRKAPRPSSEFCTTAQVLLLTSTSSEKGLGEEESVLKKRGEHDGPVWKISEPHHKRGKKFLHNCL